MSRVARPSRTVASSAVAADRQVRFVQAVGPLLRAVEQPKWLALILEKPPPQTPQLIRPENEVARALLGPEGRRLAVWRVLLGRLRRRSSWRLACPSPHPTDPD